MSEPKDGAHTRRTRLQGLVEFIMDHAGDGCSTAMLVSHALVAYGLRHSTVEQYLQELKEAGVIRYEGHAVGGGWHTTAKARGFFK